MSPSQYIALPHTSSVLPLHGYFVESKRWGEGGRPNISIGSTVTFGGLMHRIKRERDADSTVSSIEVEVLNVVYFNRSAPQTSANSKPL